MAAEIKICAAEPIPSIPAKQRRIRQSGIGRDIANGDQLPIIVQPIDPGGAALRQFRNAVDPFAITERARIRMMPAVVEHHSWGRQRSVRCRNGNNPADPIGQRHFLTQNPTCARPREWIGKVTASRLDPIPVNIAQTSRG